MRLKRQLTLVLFLLVFSSADLSAKTASVISLYKNVPSLVQHAVDRLSEYTGIPLGRAQRDQRFVRIELNAAKNPRIEPQGYTIRSTNQGIAISGNNDEGVANAELDRCRHDAAPVE